MVPLTSRMVPKLVATNANVASVTGLYKRDARLTVKNIAHSVGLSSGSTHKIWTHQLKLLGQVWRLIVSIPDLCPLSYLDWFVLDVRPSFD